MRPRQLFVESRVQDSRSGQSLIEVLVATAVGAILLVGTLSILVPALRGNSQAQYAQQGAGAARELMDNIRTWADANWNNLYSLSKGPSNQYFLAVASSPFLAATGTEGIVADGASGLIGQWKLDETVTGTAYNSASSTGNGTADGAPTATSSCHTGGCWAFNGTSQRVQITGNPALFQISTGTVSAWIKTPDAGAGYRAILAKQSAYSMFLAGNEFGVYDWTAGAWRGSGVSLNDNLWHHVACTFQSGVTNGTLCYLDGTLRLTTTMTVSGQGANLMIGEANVSSQWFTGAIDDARVYNRVLSAAEIQQLYAAPVYTRYFYVENVGRDGFGKIVASGGTDDPSTQKVTVVYAWPDVATRTISFYATRARTRVLWQTDWSAGTGQGGPATTTNNLFASSTGIDYSTTTGSLRIQGI